MIGFVNSWLFCCLLLLLPGAVMAVPQGDDAGLSAEKTFAMLEARGETILFVDVRDPVEIQFIGATNWVDVNVPFFLVDRTIWLSGKGRFAMPRNPDFVEGIGAALRAKGLGEEATIITMCRSGSGRGLPSAKYLRESGYPNSYYVIHGFQGDKVTEGPLKGFRLKNGWQNAGLPWGYELDPDKIYKP